MKHVNQLFKRVEQIDLSAFGLWLVILVLMNLPGTTYANTTCTGWPGIYEANQTVHEILAAIDREITGTVTDSEGEPLIGATITLAGTNNGKVTEINGHFAIDAETGDTL